MSLKTATKTLLAGLAATLPLAGCALEEGVSDDDLVKSEDGKADSSAVALFVDFEFDGELFSSSQWGASFSIENQLFYTIGQLNGSNAVGRLDKLELSNIQTATDGDGFRTTYHARMPVAWGSKTNVPTSVALTLPRSMDFDKLEAFVTSYSHTCIDPGAHDVDAGSMWYYFRPNRFICQLAEADVVRTTAAVTVSTVNTTGKFPEYDKVWEDNALEVVAIFGKYEDGATKNDVGISGYNAFVKAMRAELKRYAPTTIPASVPNSPGVAVPDVEIRATLPGGRSVHVVALLVDNVDVALQTAAFSERYAALSSRADLIVYNGHAGLGSNIRALARHGEWVTGQYAIVFMNGCDTYAYVDSGLNDAHQAVNPDDTTGYKYLDMVTNAMPSFFASMSGATMAMFRGLMKFDAPQTYEQIFRNVSSTQVVLVSGEQDNTFQPGGSIGAPTPTVGVWTDLHETGTLARNAEQRFTTAVLPAGNYLFELSGTGDADLYTRIGTAPTTETFDCRPYKAGSSESCLVTLAAPAPIHVMVRGFAASSSYVLEAIAE